MTIFVVCTYCELLHTTKWDEFIKNLLNDKAKRDFFRRDDKKIKIYAIGTNRGREKKQN
jgi:hypothetical protein